MSCDLMHTRCVFAYSLNVMLCNVRKKKDMKGRKGQSIRKGNQFVKDNQ